MTSSAERSASPSALTLPTLEDLPVLDLDADRIDTAGIVGFNSYDPRSRPFTLLRTQLAKRLASEKWSLLGVTSATPAAGKSFLSVNIGASLSRVAQAQIYLFDLDLRRGSLGPSLGFTPERGLGDYLSGEVDDLSSLGRRIDNSNLAIFPTAAFAGDSAALLAGARFKALIDAIRAHAANAIMLFDLPPAFANDDTMIIVQQLDAYLMVVDSGKTTRKQLTETLAMLAPAPCLGTILNRYQGGVLDPYGYGYGSASGYGEYF